MSIPWGLTDEERKEMKKTVLFSDWFDIYNVKHIKAYYHLEKKGVWPKKFIPKHVVMNMNWNLWLRIRMAGAWVNYMCKQKEVEEAFITSNS